MRYWHLAQFLSTGGDGTGTDNFIGDYSSAPVTGLIQPPDGTTYKIARMMVSVGDTAGMQAQEYGNLGAALTNGLELKVFTATNTEVANLMGGEPIHTNAEWGALCYDVDVKTWGSGNELLVARYTFSKLGEPVVLQGSGDRMQIIFNDSFDGLLSHKFLMEGMRST